MFGRFFNTTDVDQYADWVVDELKQTLPPGYDPRKKNVGKRAEILEARITQRTIEFTHSARLNLYKKARLAARVREAMIAHGYPEEFVKAFSFDLLARIQAASDRKTN